METLEDIAKKIKRDTVYMKGAEKCAYISSLFPTATFIDLVDIPAFKHLNNCIHERCDVKHGNHCARRKVYELKYAVDNYKEDDEIYIFSN